MNDEGAPSFILLTRGRRLPGAAVTFLRDPFDGDQGVVGVEVHDPHALGVAAHDADVGRRDALDLTPGGNHEQFAGGG